MTASPTTWMPIYWGDYLKDTMHLSAEENGAYLLLIAHYWCNGGPIKNCKKTIKIVSKVSSKKLEKIMPFFEEKDGYLHHSRIDEELSNSLENSRTRRESLAKARAAKAAKNASVTVSVTGTVNPPVTALPSPSPKEYNTKHLHTTSAREDTNRDRDDGGGKNDFDLEDVKARVLDLLGWSQPKYINLIETWLKAGATSDMICEVIEGSMEGCNSQSLKYFNTAMQRIINKPKPAITDYSQMTDVEIKRRCEHWIDKAVNHGKPQDSMLPEELKPHAQRFGLLK